MGFVQTIEIRTGNIDAVRGLLDDWHSKETGVAPGYQFSRVLADRDVSGRYVIVVEFESADLAAQNNEREETAKWAAALATMIDGEADFTQYDEYHRSG